MVAMVWCGGGGGWCGEGGGGWCDLVRWLVWMWCGRGGCGLVWWWRWYGDVEGIFH